MVNIIKNPGFEDGTNDWTLSSSNAVRIYDNLKASNVIRLDFLNNILGSITQSVAISANQQYTLTFAVRGYPGQLFVSVGTDNNTVNVGPENVYQTITLTGTVPAVFLPEIKFRCASGTVFIDDVNLDIGGTPALTWACENNTCVEKSDGTGQYTSLEACQAACSQVPPISSETSVYLIILVAVIIYWFLS